MTHTSSPLLLICHTLPDNVNGHLMDINVREENYPVVNVVSVAGRGSHERSIERTKRAMIAQIPVN